MRCITCASCGQKGEIAETTPLAPNFKFYCASCSSAERKRPKYSRNLKAQRELKARLEGFVGLPLRGHEGDWFRLCADLGIDSVAVEQLVAVVQERKWRASTAPRLFLKTTVTRRFAGGAGVSGLLADDVEDTVAKNNQVGFDAEYVYERRMHFKQGPNWSNAEKRTQQIVVSLFERLYGLTPTDWRAAESILKKYYDADELEVLKARVVGISRDRYLASATNAEDRKRRQAAWKRVQRKGLPDTLREELQKRIKIRLASPEWEERKERDEYWEMHESASVNEFDPRSSYGVGGGRHTKTRRRE